MAKKTLREKQLSDTRYLYRFEKVVAPQLKNIQANTATLVISDLTKTILITTLILTLQAIIFFLLKNQLIRVPGIIY